MSRILWAQDSGVGRGAQLTAGLRLGDCGFCLIPTQDENPRAQEIQLWGCSPVWWLREGVGRGPGRQGGRGPSLAPFAVGTRAWGRRQEPWPPRWHCL